ncbi:MAG: HAMP domain-containing sensor histidine kinase [Anaerolineae bacterium]|jgi:two-component system OmpR family sensor kinase
MNEIFVKTRWLWLAALLPAFLGLLVAGLIATDQLENHRVYMAGPTISVAPLIGVLLTGLLSVILLIQWRAEQSIRYAISQREAQAAQQRRRFLRRLDHELRNPLAAIRTGLANLVWLPSQETRQEVADNLDAQALRLGRLASDLRKLAELEVRPLETAPVDVGELLQEVMAVARERPDGSQRRLSLSIPEAPWPLPTVEGDQDLLFLAVHNLVDNAVKFTTPGDTVEIRALENGAGLLIEVADTGPGIPEEEALHVWDELYRGQGARGIPGSGLGLALVRAITERHGGQVDLRSRSGQGTVFTLRLPA